MNRPFELWLIWQNVETRQRYHIGNLVHEEGNFKFYYEHGKRRKLDEAMENGYRPHLAFPNVTKIYTSDRLFGPFARRLPDKRRPDFSKLVKELGLPNDYSEMDLLRATGGRLATDSYEFVHPLYVEHNHFDFDFYIAGWRYYEGDQIINQLKAGDDVQFNLHRDNPEDDKAVIVLSGLNGLQLGYIPAYYSGFMFEAIRNRCTYTAKIERINPAAVPQRKVNISVVGDLSNNFSMNNIDFNSKDLQLIKQ
ncbi:HIRAN domain protein [Paraliobacillus sp. PM-2]|uniref:HIRAN domain-containing protein n=1 Tax=Paraliobacillus sp. PM-2 TaxID=1462524 RepID=UPI00061BBAAB|nr:HIRAN domain-containing protein [Paraliobacillus sp. PM-2]CQR46245.1 HIRAN domain protein [Paraliobacillus sp. PM-2]